MCVCVRACIYTTTGNNCAIYRHCGSVLQCVAVCCSVLHVRNTVTHAQVQKCTLVQTHTHIHKHTPTHTLTHTQTHTHTRSLSHTHTYTYTRTHTHTYRRPWQQRSRCSKPRSPQRARQPTNFVFAPLRCVARETLLPITIQ